MQKKRPAFFPTFRRLALFGLLWIGFLNGTAVLGQEPPGVWFLNARNTASAAGYVYLSVGGTPDEPPRSPDDVRLGWRWDEAPLGVAPQDVSFYPSGGVMKLNWLDGSGKSARPWRASARAVGFPDIGFGPGGILWLLDDSAEAWARVLDATEAAFRQTLIDRRDNRYDAELTVGMWGTCEIRSRPFDRRRGAWSRLELPKGAWPSVPAGDYYAELDTADGSDSARAAKEMATARYLRWLKNDDPGNCGFERQLRLFPAPVDHREALGADYFLELSAIDWHRLQLFDLEPYSLTPGGARRRSVEISAPLNIIEVSWQQARTTEDLCSLQRVAPLCRQDEILRGQLMTFISSRYQRTAWGGGLLKACRSSLETLATDPEDCQTLDTTWRDTIGIYRVGWMSDWTLHDEPKIVSRYDGTRTTWSLAIGGVDPDETLELSLPFPQSVMLRLVGRRSPEGTGPPGPTPPVDDEPGGFSLWPTPLGVLLLGLLILAAPYLWSASHRWSKWSGLTLATRDTATSSGSTPGSNPTGSVDPSHESAILDPRASDPRVSDPKTQGLKATPLPISPETQRPQSTKLAPSEGPSVNPPRQEPMEGVQKPTVGSAAPTVPTPTLRAREEAPPEVSLRNSESRQQATRAAQDAPAPPRPAESDPRTPVPVLQSPAEVLAAFQALVSANSQRVTGVLESLEATLALDSWLQVVERILAGYDGQETPHPESENSPASDPRQEVLDALSEFRRLEVPLIQGLTDPLDRPMPQSLKEAWEGLIERHGLEDEAHTLLDAKGWRRILCPRQGKGRLDALGQALQYLVEAHPAECWTEEEEETYYESLGDALENENCSKSFHNLLGRAARGLGLTYHPFRLYFSLQEILDSDSIPFGGVGELGSRVQKVSPSALIGGDLPEVEDGLVVRVPRLVMTHETRGIVRGDIQVSATPDDNP